MNVKYTWYVNLVGDVQIYEGNINESMFNEVHTLEEAKQDQSIKHEIRERRQKGLFRKSWYYPIVGYEIEHRPNLKYWIPSEYAEAFFTCINELPQLMGSSGCTDVELSDFLD